jgi:16S rRNA (uracil1498-N3)-methyltransferase
MSPQPSADAPNDAGTAHLPRYFVAAALAEGAAVALEGAEAHHLATVCRARPGENVCLFNGDGHEYVARVLAAERRRVTLAVTARASPARELPFLLEVAAPLPKGDRAQFLVEKLTELGATRFVPLVTRRSGAQAREARPEKLTRYVIEASKQCGRNRLLEVAAPAAWPAYCAAAAPEARKVLAHPGGAAAAPVQALAAAPGQAVLAAVGPEGGFTEEEVGLARSAGWQPLDLGPRILRVETAALVLAAWAAGPAPRLG